VTADDAQLLARWRDGDERAGRALFERYDLVHDTFLGLVRARDEFRGDASVRTLLFVIARRRLVDHLERDRREALEPGATSPRDPRASPSQALAAGQDERLLLRALRSLPLEQQLAVELHYWEDLSGPEIAEVLGVPANTVRGRLARAALTLIFRDHSASRAD
jgi:RNA polymerase sigma-70 factor (ECF subfamily)